jgi:hypothetical protein
MNEGASGGRSPTTTLETGSKTGSLDGPSWRHKSRIISVLF